MSTPQLAVATPPAIELPGIKVMLVGDTGTGKTHSIRTLIEAGLETFVIFTEPGMETLADVPCEKGMHWHYIQPTHSSWSAMLEMATKINTLSYESLTKTVEPNKNQYRQYMDILSSLAAPVCDRCGKKFSMVDSWGSDKALVMDSWTGTSLAAFRLHIGGKPTAAPGEYGIAMNTLEGLMNTLTTALKCHFVLTAHLEREVDEVTGGVTLMASTVGRKLAPKIPRFFSDVIQCTREGDKFTWNTTNSNAVLKARNLPWAINIPPTFVPLIEKWRQRIYKKPGE